MNRRSVLALAALVAAAIPARAQNAPQLLSHDVYFSLNDASPAARDALVAACKKYLTGHPGVVSFSAGVLASELNRPVNDRDFDVALHVVFDGKASHDKYQDAARHKQFIEENQKNWKKVRVFDSLVDAVK
jgi:stress responsive alpha/beta barrel protein